MNVVIYTRDGRSVHLCERSAPSDPEQFGVLVSVSDWSERAAVPSIGDAGEAPSAEIVLDDAAGQAVRLLGVPIDADAHVDVDGARLSGRVTVVDLHGGRMVLTIEP